MLYRITFWIVCLVVLIEKCVSDEHIYGTKKGLDFYSNEILNTNQTIPKNYTILFEYAGSAKSPSIDYCKIEINAKSIAIFKTNDREKKIFKAIIYIYNASNVIASISLSGDAATFQHSLDFLSYYHEHASKNAPSRSFTMIYVKNATSSGARNPFFRNAIGTRQSGDALLHFESRNVTNGNRFPSRSFEYIGNDTTRITLVGFSFNSPTAIAFINTTFVLQNEFSAVAYDMNVEHFVANVSIYGFANFGQHSELIYKDIVEPKEICCWCSYFRNIQLLVGNEETNEN